MKKLYFLFLLFLTPGYLFAISGFGTFARPYSGSITADTTWNTISNKIFINGDITVTANLTINPGLTIVFVSAGADLIISGNGILTASGTAGSPIRFTADYNNNGVYGESGERWGHIVFWNMNISAGSSTMNYCIVEWGDVSGTSNTTTYGGGIFIRSFSGLSLNNCIIRNNKATHGGGIMAYKDASGPPASPTITNTVVDQNTAVTSGGGIYLHTGSVSILTNCIVNYNSAGVGGGGGIFLDVCANVRVVNSTIVKNTTSAPARGFNIQYYNISNTLIRPRFINCIAWGSDNSITHVNFSQQSSDFNYCAIQDVSTPASVYTNCIDLNALNGAANGPNFVNPNLPVPDWSITLISPCRDAGTNSYPGVTIPPLDIAGNSRAGAVDIGAYEVIYNRWKTTASSTDWATAGNWEAGVPTSSQDIIIPTGATNYPTGSSSQDFTIGSGKLMVLNPGAQATLGVLINSGTLRLESDANGISSLICSSYSGNDAEVQLYLKGGPGTYGPNWHYISSPFNSLSTTVFTSVTLDLAQWVENLASANLLIGWVAYDGFVYRFDVNPPYTGPTFSNLAPGKGYNHFFASNYLYTLKGQLNTSDAVANLSYTVVSPDQPTRYGLNLLGNPFSSGLNWDLIANGPGYPANTSKAIYFNKSGSFVYYVNGVGSDPGVTGIVPPMQGFFTKTYSTGHSITLPASARVNGSIPARYKKSETIIPLVRINLTSGSYNDYTVVRFDNSAKSGMDYDFDAPKLFLSATYPYIYSVSDGNMFAINGQPFPDSTMEIPFVVNIPSAGNNSLSATQLQGLDNYKVTLTDKTTGIETNLKTTPVVSFSASQGLLADRFVLKVSNISTGYEDPVTSTGVFNIYPSSGYINIRTIADEWDGKTGTVRVLDLSGKVVIDRDNNYFSINSLISLPARLPGGIYIVEIRSGAKRYVGKIVIR